MHETNAQVPSGAGIPDADGPSEPLDHSVIRWNHAGDDVHQGRFPGSVFTDKRVDLAHEHVHGYIRQDSRAPELLVDALQAKERASVKHLVMRRNDFT